jgi:hypothetical protein
VRNEPQHFAAAGVTLGFLRHLNLPGFSETAVIDGYGRGAPIGGQETTLNVSMNTGMRPLRWARDIPVLDRVVMDIIHVVANIFLVAKGVFPIAALPYSAFALVAPAGVDVFAFRQPSAESGFDQHPSHRTIDVSGRQHPYGMDMVGQDHHGVDMERVALF